jgi:hypothetical protein
VERFKFLKEFLYFPFVLMENETKTLFIFPALF